MRQEWDRVHGETAVIDKSCRNCQEDSKTNPHQIYGFKPAKTSSIEHGD